MNAITEALKEIYGLFVEDGSYAIAICTWLIIIAFILPTFRTPHQFLPYLFVAGLAAILIENVIRSANKR